MIEIENLQCNWSADFLKIAKESPIIRVYIPDFKENLDCSACKKPVVSKKDIVAHFGMYFRHLECVKSIVCGCCQQSYNLDVFEGETDKVFGFLCKACKLQVTPCSFCNLSYLPANLIDGHCANCRIQCRMCSKTTGKSHIYKIKGVAAYCWTCAQRDIWVKPHDFNPLTILKFQGNPKKGLYYGVELELECDDEPKAVKMAEDLSKNFGKYLVVKHDGSLACKGRAGLEVVTAPGDMRFHQDLWKKFFEQGYQFQSRNSIRCSTHVHMSKSGLKEMQLARMAYFMYAPTNRQFIQIMAGRRLDNEWGEKYSRISPKIMLSDIVEVYGSRSYWKRETGNNTEEILNILELPAKSKQLKYKHGGKMQPHSAEGNTSPGKFDRYTALNVQNPTTAEMRIFCGTDSYHIMMKNLEFCQALIAYCEIGQTAYSDLARTGCFIKFLKEYRSCYPHLISYLSKKHPEFQKKTPKQIEIELKDCTPISEKLNQPNLGVN